MNIFKERPVKVIYGSSLFLCLYIISMNSMRRIDVTYYILSSVIISLIYIYAIYVKVNLDYEKVNTKFKLLKFRFDVINGHLIYKILIYIITCLTFILSNSNPFQKEKFDFISTVFICLLALILVPFIKITIFSKNSNGNYLD
jgi:hypothetical protein